MPILTQHPSIRCVDLGSVLILLQLIFRAIVITFHHYDEGTKVPIVRFICGKRENCVSKPSLNVLHALKSNDIQILFK